MVGRTRSPTIPIRPATQAASSSVSTEMWPSCVSDTRKITPAWVPLPHLWSYLTGAIEVIAGVLQATSLPFIVAAVALLMFASR